MNDRADRLKAALRENLKRRKAHMRDRDERGDEQQGAQHQSGGEGRKAGKAKDV